MNSCAESNGKNEHELEVVPRKATSHARITQHQLAVIQQIQSELASLEEDQDSIGSSMQALKLQLRTKMKALRQLIHDGAVITPGPLRLFVRKGGKIDIK